MKRSTPAACAAAIALAFFILARTTGDAATRKGEAAFDRGRARNGEPPHVKPGIREI